MTDIPENKEHGVFDSTLEYYYSVSNGEYIALFNNNRFKWFKALRFENDADRTAPKVLIFSHTFLSFIICDHALENCNLIDVILPENLEEIGDYAFANNPLLKSVHIPYNCKKIGQHVFDGCNIEHLIVPPRLDLVQKIIDEYGTQIKSITIEYKEEDYTSKDAVVRWLENHLKLNQEVGDKLQNYTIEPPRKYQRRKLFIYDGILFDYLPDKSYDTLLVIPEGVHTVVRSALNSKGLNFVSFPSTMLDIQKYAFAGNELKCVELPYGMRFVDEYAFMSCHINEVIIHSPSVTFSKGTFFRSSIGNLRIPFSFFKNHSYNSIDELINFTGGNIENLTIDFDLINYGEGKNTFILCSDEKEANDCQNSEVETAKYDENVQKLITFLSKTCMPNLKSITINGLELGFLDKSTITRKITKNRICSGTLRSKPVKIICKKGEEVLESQNEPVSENFIEVDNSDTDKISKLMSEIKDLLTDANQKDRQLIEKRISQLFKEYKDSLDGLKRDLSSKESLKLQLYSPLTIKVALEVQLEEIKNELEKADNREFATWLNIYQRVVAEPIDVTPKEEPVTVLEKIEFVTYYAIVYKLFLLKSRLFEALSDAKDASELATTRFFEIGLRSKGNSKEEFLTMLDSILCETKNAIIIMKALMGKGESLLALTIENYLRILEDLDPVTAERYNALLESIQQKYRVTEDWSNIQEKEIAIRRDLKALLDDLAPRVPSSIENKDLISKLLACRDYLQGEQIENFPNAILDVVGKIVLLNREATELSIESKLEDLTRFIDNWITTIVDGDPIKIVAHERQIETDLLPNNWDILPEILQIELTILKRLYALKIEIEESIEKQKNLNSCEKVLDLTPKAQ